MKQLLAFWEKTLNLPSERIAEILFKKADDGVTVTDDINDDALQTLLDLDKARVSKLKDDGKVTFDNGYKKAEKDVSDRWEKSLRERFAIESSVIGDDLIAAIQEKLQAKVPAKPTTDDDIKKHPTFLAMERQYLADVKAAQEAGTKALEDYKAEQGASQMKAVAKSKAKEMLLAMKPVLEDDQTIAETRLSDFQRELESYDYQEVEGELIPIKDGKRVENEHKHPLSFTDLAKQIATRRFKFQVQDPKGNGGNQNPTGAAGGSTNLKFASRTDFENAYFAEPDSTKRTEMAKAYEDQSRE